MKTNSNQTAGSIYCTYIWLPQNKYIFNEHAIMAYKIFFLNYKNKVCYRFLVCYHTEYIKNRAKVCYSTEAIIINHKNSLITVIQFWSSFSFALYCEQNSLITVIQFWLSLSFTFYCEQNINRTQNKIIHKLCPQSKLIYWTKGCYCDVYFQIPIDWNINRCI